MIRHLRDSKVGKMFNSTFLDFAFDLQNVCLDLVSDCFNSIVNLSIDYDIWLAALIPYNLPPKICMNQTSFILSLIIHGKPIPKKDMDVYL